jgi:hypothetical protein
MLDMPFEEGSFDLAIFNKIIVEISYQDLEVLCEQLKKMLVQNGLFCIVMSDGLRRISDGKVSVDDYITANGMKVETMDIGDNGKQVYTTYFWTLAFARHILDRYFKLIKEIEYHHNNYWLIYCNSNGVQQCK